jgi:hypothetical protein
MRLKFDLLFCMGVKVYPTPGGKDMRTLTEDVRTDCWENSSTSEKDVTEDWRK